MTFLSVLTKLDLLSMYFSLFLLDVCLRDQMVSAVWFCPAAKDRRTGPIPVQPWSLWGLMSSAQI